MIVAVDELSVEDAETGVMGEPDTEDWAPGPVAPTRLVTIQVNPSVAEKPASGLFSVSVGPFDPRTDCFTAVSYNAVSVWT